MNSETLISQAGYAIDMFKIDHDSACVLTVNNGFVRGHTLAEVGLHYPKTLMIDCYELRRGLTAARWHAIGKELFKLYNKEKSCQAHPKP